MSRLHVYQEGTHFISSLQLVDANIRQRHKDEANVRWIVIGLHDALYALLIEKVVRTDGFGIYKDSFERKVSDFYKKGLGSDSPEFKELLNDSLDKPIAGIGLLLKRAGINLTINPHPDEVSSLESPSLGLYRLKEMRNFFSHPRPMIAGYYENFLLEAVVDTIKVIREALDILGQRSNRHDPREAALLLDSIEFYSQKWELESLRQSTLEK